LIFIKVHVTNVHAQTVMKNTHTNRVCSLLPDDDDHETRQAGAPQHPNIGQTPPMKANIV